MRRVDISMPLFAGMPMFPGDPPFESRSVSSLAGGDPYDLSALSFGSHAGTHIDPPSHFLRGGVTVDRLDLDVLVGPCRVVEMGPSTTTIGAKEAGDVPRGTVRVLFRTANSTRWKRELSFFPDFVGLTVAAAEVLLERGVRLVGIDALSIENDPTETYPVHRALLGRGVVLLEGLVLADAPTGEYRLECLPLRLKDGDGGPARATLVTEEATGRWR
jgi:arylformamidase